MTQEKFEQLDVFKEVEEKQERAKTTANVGELTPQEQTSEQEIQTQPDVENQSVGEKSEDNNRGDLSKKVCLTDVNVIKILKRKRELNSDHLTALKESISKLGLIEPIVITDKNILIAGYHRLQAFKDLNYAKIPTVIKNVDEINAELLEIDENLIRHELTQLEKSEQLQRRKEIYEILNPNTKANAVRQNNLPKRNDFVLGDEQETQVQEKSFTQETSEKTGLSQRSIQQSVQIAENLTEEAKDKIKEVKLEDNKTALLEVARTEPEKQLEKIDELVDKKVNKTKESKEPKEPKELPLEYKVDFVRKKVVINDKWYDLPEAYDMENSSYKNMVMIAKNKNGMFI